MCITYIYNTSEIICEDEEMTRIPDYLGASIADVGSGRQIPAPIVHSLTCARTMRLRQAMYEILSIVAR